MMIYLYLHLFQNVWHVLSRKHKILWRGSQPHLSKFYDFANVTPPPLSPPFPFARQSYCGVNSLIEPPQGWRRYETERPLAFCKCSLCVKKCSPLLISCYLFFLIFFLHASWNITWNIWVTWSNMRVLTCSDYDNSCKGLHYCQISSSTIMCVVRGQY